MKANSMRLGKMYLIINHGERYRFELIEFIGEDDYRFKDSDTLEQYTYSDIVRYGKGKDFEIREL